MEKNGGGSLRKMGRGTSLTGSSSSSANCAPTHQLSYEGFQTRYTLNLPKNGCNPPCNDIDVEYDPKTGEERLWVECGKFHAYLYIGKLCQGSKGKAVLYKDEWYTPNQFQSNSGRETAKDWKRSIKHKTKSLKALMSNSLLFEHNNDCLCAECRGSSLTSTAAAASPPSNYLLGTGGGGVKTSSRSKKSKPAKKQRMDNGYYQPNHEGLNSRSISPRIHIHLPGYTSEAGRILLSDQFVSGPLTDVAVAHPTGSVASSSHDIEQAVEDQTTKMAPNTSPYQSMVNVSGELNQAETRINASSSETTRLDQTVEVREESRMEQIAVESLPQQADEAAADAQRQLFSGTLHPTFTEAAAASFPRSRARSNSLQARPEQSIAGNRKRKLEETQRNAKISKTAPSSPVDVSTVEPLSTRVMRKIDSRLSSTNNSLQSVPAYPSVGTSSPELSRLNSDTEKAICEQATKMAEWDLDRVGSFLDKIGLGQYKQVFRDNKICGSSLPLLREYDVDKLGMKMGDGHLLMSAVHRRLGTYSLILVAHHRSSSPSSSLSNSE